MSTKTEIIAEIQTVADATGVNTIRLGLGAPGNRLVDPIGELKDSGMAWVPEPKNWPVVIEGIAHWIDTHGAGPPGPAGNPGAAGGSLRFCFDSNVGAPAANHFSLDDADPTLAGHLYISDTDSDAGNIESWIQLCNVGSLITIYKLGDYTCYLVYLVHGFVTDSGGYWDFPVSWIASYNEGDIVNDVQCFIAQIIMGAEGAPGAPGLPGPPGPGTVVDLTGAAKHVTANALPGGGTATGHIHVTIHEGICTRLRVKANGNTTDSDVEFFSAAGEVAANSIYFWDHLDCFTSPYHVDREPWAIPGFATPLTTDELHYRIVNNGANASTYDIEMVLMGEV